MLKKDSYPLIGSFQSVTAPNYMLQALKDMEACGGNSMMIYTGSPQFFKRTPIEKMKVKEFFTYAKEINFDFNNLIVHAPYVMNLATNDERIKQLTIDFLNQEIKRCEAINCHYMVVHPGSATNGLTIEQAINNCANIINQLSNHNVTICLETMAGKGNEIGKSFSQLASIISLVKNKENIGICLDTCHLNDAGYDLSDVNKIYKDFTTHLDIKYLHVIHLNDSKNPCGAHSDRHENIGYGTIGFNNLMQYVYYDKFKNIPKILETPIEKDLVFTYQNEIKNIVNNKFQDWKNK